MDVVVSGNFGQFWLAHALSRVWPSAAVPLLKHCLSTANHVQYTEKSICQWWAAKHTLFPVIPMRNSHPMTVLCPWQTPQFSRLTASPQVLITSGTWIITCVKRVLHVFTTCAARGCPQAKILSCSKLFAASDAVSIFPCVDCSSS